MGLLGCSFRVLLCGLWVVLSVLECYYVVAR